MNVLDPLKFAATFWPDLRFYKEQEDIIYSVMYNAETDVKAGNELGKDFVAAFIALWWFCSRRPARVVTTSVKMEQLNDVLWGEIRRFLATARYNLPIQYNHMKIRQRRDDGTLEPRSELVGQVSNTQEGLLGRHASEGFVPIQGDIPRTLVIFDEASGVDDTTYKSTRTWADHTLAIGNPWPCENFFRRNCDGGDVPRDPRRGYYRKVFSIKAEHSPNVRYARAEIAKGKAPSNRVLVPGVKTWAKYCENRATWDPELQCVGLDGEFYKGPQLLLFPNDVLVKSAEQAFKLARLFPTPVGRCAERFLGCDPGEGGANTSWSVVDAKGVLELVSMKTPNTAKIKGETRAIARAWGVPPEATLLDRGGGGLQIADELREAGFEVMTIGFGEAIATGGGPGELDEDREARREERYVWVNRRAQMYGELSLLVGPTDGRDPFAIPANTDELRELHRQLGKMPRLRDGEGRGYLPPKSRRPGTKSKEKTLTELLGCSPDEADATVLAVHAMLHPSGDRPAGPMW